MEFEQNSRGALRHAPVAIFAPAVMLFDRQTLLLVLTRYLGIYLPASSRRFLTRNLLQLLWNLWVLISHSLLNLSIYDVPTLTVLAVVLLLPGQQYSVFILLWSAGLPFKFSIRKR